MKGMIQVIDINAFLLMLIGVLCSALLIVLIVLSVKLIHTINRVNKMLDDIDIKLSKFERAFRLVDILTDNMALISDKVVDGISYFIRKVFYKKEKGKEAENHE